MRNQRLCGYDVNGWRDSVVRNWAVQLGNKEEQGLLRSVEGSVLPEVVRAGDEQSERWVGGAQADLAPHGRGTGWGLVGKADRRKTVRSLIKDSFAQPEMLAAAFTGLTSGASHSVVAIEDTEHTTEPIQDSLFKALKHARSGKSLLVWRSVLSLLHALNEGILGPAASDGALIGIIGHVGSGFSIQTLRIRNDEHGTESLMAPERSQVGKLVQSEMGYEGLVDAATRQILSLAPAGPFEHFQSARAIGRLAFGLTSKPEPLRRSNGDWDILTPPDALDASTFAKALPSDTLRDCAVILFESLTEGLVRSEVIRWLQLSLSAKITDLPAFSVARGALLAAERYAAGQTVYLDFLPRITTIVSGKDGVESYDLIKKAETLPAGSLYRSPKPAKFSLKQGQASFNVYLKKDNEKEPRCACVKVGKVAKKDAEINLWVEQKPAAGRARIWMQAPSLSREFSVDWDSAEVLNQTWEELLAEIRDRPTLPDRLVLDCGMRAWKDNSKSNGLLSLLKENVEKRSPDWDALQKKLRQPFLKKYCISSEGEVPDEVPQEALEQLDQLNERAVSTLQRMERGRVSANTAPLSFLTWQFRRCPRDVVLMLLNAWEAKSQNRSHPFATRPMAWVLIRQGLGRIVSDPADEKRAIDLLMNVPIRNWKWREETAAAALLLSRSDSCPELLKKDTVEKLGQHVISEFNQSYGSDYTKFQYVPSLLLGLLRWRLVSPRALIDGDDELASNMAKSVKDVQKDMLDRASSSEKLTKAADKWIPFLEKILEEIRGKGGHPDLLATIYNPDD